MRKKIKFIHLFIFVLCSYCISGEAQSTYKFHKYEFYTGGSFAFSMTKGSKQNIEALVLVDYPNIIWAKKTYQISESFSSVIKPGFQVGVRRNYELSKKILMAVAFQFNYQQVSRSEKYVRIKIDSVKAENVNRFINDNNWRDYTSEYVFTPPNIQRNFQFLSLEFPISIGRIPRIGKFIPEAGLTPSLILSSTYKNKFVFDPERNTELSGKTNALFNVHVNAGFSYSFNRGISIGVDYKYGLINLFENSAAPLYIQSFSLQLRKGIFK